MKYNIQNNLLWKDNIMTQGKDKYGKEWIDKLKDYGCLVTAYANINQEHSNIEFTPLQLNYLIIGHNGYFWLCKDKNNNINYYGKDIEVKCDNASFLNTKILDGILLSESIGWLKSIDYKKEDNVYWIARITTSFGGHYINVLYRDKNNNFVCFDTYSGLVNILSSDKIIYLTKVKFRI